MVLLIFIGLMGIVPLLFVDAVLSKLADKTVITPWVSAVWFVVWFGPPVAKFIYWSTITLAKIWWEGVTEK